MAMLLVKTLDLRRGGCPLSAYFRVHQIPVGGRSMFGAAGLPIPKEALRRRPSSSSDSGDDGVKNGKTVPNR